ncbi:MAG: cell division protein FtsL [Gallionella sp.]|nr:cell division protein FtsL [Gallionella sp.]
MQLNRTLLNVVVLVIVVLCALSVVTSQHKARKLYVSLQQEKDSAQKIEVEWGQLQLEQSTLATLARIEKIATQRLQMQLPKNEQVQYIRLDTNKNLENNNPDNPAK